MERFAGLRWSVWFVGICIGAPAHAQTTVGRTAGEASVSTSGNARYTIPLYVPPGTNGVAPQLGIAYDHASGNGLLGVGFHLAGFSAIHRCGKTWAQDGAVASVGLDRADRFCLDGQRLRLTSGAYAQPGSQYQTEVETFARVTAFGSAGSGPAWFQVERRDGLIYQYGATTDARIESAGSTTPREWALNRIRDRSGNYIDFVYAEDVATGSYRPTRVDYTGNATLGATPYYSMRFSYESRATGDEPSAYFAGGPIRQPYRLARIDVQHTSGAVLRSYVLNYGTDSPTGRSRLVRVEECAGGKCLPATRFEWTSSVPGWTAATPLGLDAATLQTALGGDLNGDGFDDLAYFDEDKRAWLVRNGGANGLSPTPISTGVGAGSSALLALEADLDGDGRRDVVVPGAGNLWYWLHWQGETNYVYTSTGLNFATGSAGTFSDIDGDGRDDFVRVNDTGSGLLWRRNITTNGIAYFTGEALLWNAPSGTRIAAVPFSATAQQHRSVQHRPDFNGDGREDLLLHVQVDGCAGQPGCAPVWLDRWQVLASRGSVVVAAAQFEAAVVPALADFNADGLTDIAYAPVGTYWRVLFGAGRRAALDAAFAILTVGNLPAQVTAALSVDWDGDRRSDLLVANGSEWLVCRSLGTGLDTCRAAGLAVGGATTLPLVLDANGDGLPDLVNPAPPSGVHSHASGKPDLLASVVDGLELRIAFDFAPLTRPGMHVAGSMSSYPVIDRVTPAWVVSRLSQSDGAGGNFDRTYAYEGAKAQLLGRGFLGFARRSETDSRTGLVTVEDYLQNPLAFDQIGAVSATTLRQPSGAPVFRRRNYWSQLTTGTGPELRSFPYVASSVGERFELDGTLVTTTYERNIVDAYGAVIYRTSTTSEAGGGMNAGSYHFEQIRLSDVTNDVTNWCLGRPGTIQVTRSHSLPGGQPAVRTTSQSVDPYRCRVTQQVEEPGSTELRRTISTGYDSWGNVAALTESAAGETPRTQSYSWGNAGRFLQIHTDAEGFRTTVARDPVTSLRTGTIDANGLSTEWQYDHFGRVARESHPDGTWTEFTQRWCDTGCNGTRASLLMTVTDHATNGAAVKSSTLGFDLMDREVFRQSEQPGGVVSRVLEYDGRGQLARQSMPDWCCGVPAFWITREYDLLGRPTAISRPASASDPVLATIRWQHAGLSTTMTDALGRTSVGYRDAAGNLVRSIDAGNADTDYEYDAFGNLLRVRDFHGNETVMTYDSRGRRLSVSDPDAGLRTFRYSGFDELKSATNARGQTVSYAYDRLSRPITRQEPEGVTTWTWGNSQAQHNVGAMTRISGAGFVETHEYDLHGRLAVQSTSAFGNTFVTRLDYDATTGKLDTLTYPALAGATPLRLRHRYDHGRLVELSDADSSGAPFWRAEQFDALGNVSVEVLGNGVRVANDSDPVTGLLRSRSAGPGASRQYQDLRYSWDPVGNLTSREEGGLGVLEEFSYDGFDRLVSMRSSAGASVDLAYDEIGNLTFKSDVGQYRYDTVRTHAVVAAGDNTYAYDANGDVVEANGATITWTSFDLPQRIIHPAGNYSTFDYRPDRTRLRQLARSSGEITDTVYAAGGLYERVSRNGITTERNYIMADGRRVAVQVRAVGADPDTTYLLVDHLGGVDGFMSATGELLARTSSQPFGARRAGDWSGSAPADDEWRQVLATTPRGFADQEHIDNLGVIHMNGRVYDPVLGRFLSPDPVVQAPYDAQSWNRYSYVRNNPLRYTDPSGFVCQNLRQHPAIVSNCVRNVVERIVVEASRLRDQVAAGSISVPVVQVMPAGSSEAGGASGLVGAMTPGPVEEIVITAPPIESALLIPVDVGLVLAANLMVSAAADQVLQATTELGADAAQHYADLQVQTGNDLYSIPGTLASLWTPDTAQETILVLGAASGVGAWSGRPYWQYFPAENSAYQSTWLTRGAGWAPPYETGLDAAANLSLPPYNPGTAVRAVQPPWYQYVRGPRVTAPRPDFGRGAVGGGREYRVLPFEQ